MASDTPLRLGLPLGSEARGITTDLPAEWRGVRWDLDIPLDGTRWLTG